MSIRVVLRSSCFFMNLSADRVKYVKTNEDMYRGTVGETGTKRGNCVVWKKPMGGPLQQQLGRGSFPGIEVVETFLKYTKYVSRIHTSVKLANVGESAMKRGFGGGWKKIGLD